MAILVVGSVAYDDIVTPLGTRKSQLGGSAVYFSLAASYFGQVQLVGVVGGDFADSDKRLLADKGIDISGLHVADGETFRWSGSYVDNLNEVVTLDTQLNVFESFKPQLVGEQRRPELLFLANIAPQLQTSVLDSMEERPRVVAGDTMNLWISQNTTELKALMGRVDVAFMNENEAKSLTGIDNLPSAATAVLELGTKSVVIKRGEYGAALFCREFTFALPAYPLTEVADPTGAGDSFAGGFMGSLAREHQADDEAAVRRAMVYGSAMASFTVASFGTDGLCTLDMATLTSRVGEFAELTRFSSTPQMRDVRI